MKFLITGHTGFKGSWLSLLLNAQGHELFGISLDPNKNSFYRQANLSDMFSRDIRLDICDKNKLSRAIKRIEPDVIIHLAAQSIVRKSYLAPMQTFETNVLGTLNVLESTRRLENIKATLIITTDKVYKNDENSNSFVETDPLGGYDPYSGSKAAADIAAQSWINSFANAPVAIARAGNVIGGGDWSSDRLVPDIVRSILKSEQIKLRFPDAVRPWQHVLDCLNGYLTLIHRQVNEKFDGSWNFGPNLEAVKPVKSLVNSFTEAWGIKDEKWIQSENDGLQESKYLSLDSSKARNILGWREKLNFEDSISWTVDWYRNVNSKNVQQISMNQVEKFLKL